jgi:hypothetical protein
LVLDVFRRETQEGACPETTLAASKLPVIDLCFFSITVFATGFLKDFREKVADPSQLFYGKAAEEFQQARFGWLGPCEIHVLSRITRMARIQKLLFPFALSVVQFGCGCGA